MLNFIKRIDEFVLNRVSKLGNKAFSKWMVVISIMGNSGLVWFAIAVPLILNRSYRLIGVKIILSILLTGFLGEIIVKRAVARVRPSKSILQEDLLIKKPKSYSFPSGHTSSSVAAACTIAFCCGPISILAFIFAFFMALSRLYLRVHYLSDVLAGAVLGVICSFIVNVFIF